MPKSPNSLACYVETVPGLEEVAWLEIRDRFPQAQFGDFMFAKDKRGVVLFEYPGALQDLFKLRTAEAIFVVVTYVPKVSRGYGDLKELREQLARTGDLGRAVNLLARYRRRQVNRYHLVTRKYGKHQYSRDDFRRAVIRAIETINPNWQRVQKDADVEIWANVFGSSILLGLMLPPPRGWRPPETQPGTVPESVAAAMTLLTEPGPGDIFLDPLCDAGAIVGARTASAARLILGGDVTAEDVVIAARNTGQQAALLQWDAGSLPLMDGSVDKVATRFPGSIKEGLAQLYSRWLGELQRVLRPEGHAVILTREYALFKDVIREHPVLTILGGYSVTINEEWGRIYLVQRLP